MDGDIGSGRGGLSGDESTEVLPASGDEDGLALQGLFGHCLNLHIVATSNYINGTL